MFSYQNKVVGIKITGQAGSDLFDVLVNSAYVGTTTGTIEGDGAYLIASSDNSLGLTGVYNYPSQYPSSVLFEFFEDYYITGYSSGVSYNLGYPFSGYFGDIGTDFGGSYIITNTGSEDFWKLQYLGETGILSIGGSDPSNPYGTYSGALDTTITISPDPLRLPQTPVYHFSDLVLNEGSNELCFINNLNNGSGNKLFYEIGLYELSGSYLVNPSIIQTGEITPTTGTDECLFFDLAYPSGGSIPTFEFDPVFNLDTGNLDQVFTGSGVHLQKDVTFFFDVLDQQLNSISSDQQMIENPLISGCVFDILNIDGSTAVENFFTGKYSRSVTVTALDNENIFGDYQKDFGVRCKLPNTFDGSIFTGVFLAYGNVPNILEIIPDYAEFSGAPQVTDSLNASIVLQNDLKFTQMDRYDVYALTGSGSAANELTFLDPTSQEGYLLSQSATNASDTYALTINRGELLENTPYYFTVVPYGALGSGNPFVFGPTTFVQQAAELIPLEADVTAVNLYDGSGFSSTLYKTGLFTGNAQILHQFSSESFTSVKYLVEIFDPSSLDRRLSEINGVIASVGPSIMVNSVNDVLTDYQLTGLLDSQFGLLASGNFDDYSGYNYKLIATLM